MHIKKAAALRNCRGVKIRRRQPPAWSCRYIPILMLENQVSWRGDHKKHFMPSSTAGNKTKGRRHSRQGNQLRPTRWLFASSALLKRQINKRRDREQALSLGKRCCRLLNHRVRFNCMRIMVWAAARGRVVCMHAPLL